MKRTCFESEACPMARSLDAIGDWWSLLIVRDAYAGKRRFGEFQTSLGVAKNILAARLKNLVTRGVLAVVPASDGSAYQEYVLTEHAQGLWIVMMALRQWGEMAFFTCGELEYRLVDKRDRKPLRPLELRSHDGRILGPEDVIPIPTGSGRNHARKTKSIRKAAEAES